VAKGAYFIIKGMVKVNQYDSKGKEQILFFFSPAELFGYRALLTNDKHSISAICIEDCEIKFIESNNFLKLIESSEILTRQILSRVSHEFTILLNRVYIFAQKGDKGRLSFALLVLNEKFKAQNMQTGVTPIKISISNLSAFTGLSVEIVSSNLNYFVEINAIEIADNTISIKNFDILHKTSGNT
jgi:CRP/FNR family transcriptional regulator